MSTDRPIPDFSPREKQLLEFAAAGFTDTAIANRLGISEATVGTYWGRVRIKLGPFSRTELVAIVLRAEGEAAVESLRRKNEQLVQALRDSAAADAQESHRMLLDNAPDAMILVTEGGSLQYGNQVAAELFGYSQAEMEGLDLDQLVPPRFREIHVKHRADFIANPERRQMGAHLDTPAVRKDGTEFPIRAALSSMQTPAGLLLICAIRPVESS